MLNIGCKYRVFFSYLPNLSTIIQLLFGHLNKKHYLCDSSINFRRKSLYEHNQSISYNGHRARV